MLYPDLDELVAFKDCKVRSELTSHRAVKSSVPGDHHSPFRGQGLEFDSVREYVPGDDIRNIDWKVTARTGYAHLKLFREERERSVILCVDMNEAMQFGTKNTFKSVQAAKAAAILGWRALASQNRVGACLYGQVPEGMQFFTPHRTRKSLGQMLNTLVTPSQENHHVALEEALRHLNKAAHTGALIYLISDFLEVTENLERMLSRLNKRADVIAIAINDPAEKTIPPLSTLAFQGQEREKMVINTDSVAGREAYEAQWKTNRKQVEEMLSRQKIAMISMTTEAKMPSDLIFGLKKIAKRRGR